MPAVSLPFTAPCTELRDVPLCPHSHVMYQPLFSVFIQFAICTVAEGAVHPTIQVSNEEVRPRAQTKRKISSPQPKTKLSTNAPEHPVHGFPSELGFTTLTCSSVEWHATPRREGLRGLCNISESEITFSCVLNPNESPDGEQRTYENT